MPTASRTIRVGDRRVMPWRNGQGSTTELAVEPPGASLDSFDWRVSIAELRGSGVFSRFPGYNRIIVQLDGPPMTLTHGAGTPVALEQLVPHAFPGDDETACDLSGIAHDFNLIVRRGVARAMLTVHRLGQGEEIACAIGAVTVLHVLEGDLVGADGVLLNTGDTRIERVADRTSYCASRRAVVLLSSLT